MLERFKNWIRYHKLKAWFDDHERLLIPGALVFGVIVDFVTFRSIQISSTFIILGVYLVLAGASIILLNVADPSNRLLKYTKLFAPILLQFTLGALLSMSLIFYWFSGSLSVSWPLLIVIAFLMTSNEVFRRYYLRPIVQMSVFYFALFSLSTLFFPYIFNTIESWVFLLGGGVSLVVMLVYLVLLMRVSNAVKQKRFPSFASIVAIFLVMNSLYVLNIIPPIPLSLREAGVYHSVARSGGSYVLLDEEKSFLEKLFPIQKLHLATGERAYVFTSIFAPSELNTSIVHHWQFYDGNERKWIDKDRLSFTVSGGRQEGYRGYSLKSSLQPGPWRVRVETPRGQVLGTVRFTVQSVNETVSLLEVRK